MKTGRRAEEVCPGRGRREGRQVREGVPGREGPAVGGGETGEERGALEKEEEIGELFNLSVFFSSFVFRFSFLFFYLRPFFLPPLRRRNATTSIFCVPFQVF